MIRQLLAGDKSLVTYRPSLREIGGSIAGTVLLQQIIYWDEKSDGKFYKFAKPCKHKLYKVGDSWEEELGMSAKELRTALGQFAFKCGAKNKELHGEDYKEARKGALLQYYTDSNRVTWYLLNRNVLSKLLLGIYKESAEVELTLITETTQETTTESSAGAESKESETEQEQSPASPILPEKESVCPAQAFIDEIWGDLNGEVRERGGIVASKKSEYVKFFKEVGDMELVRKVFTYLRSDANLKDQYGWVNAAYNVGNLRNKWNPILLKAIPSQRPLSKDVLPDFCG